ncbi:MAG: serine/threonine protein kinase [Acidobacteria bacterium]|nr:serine/threonine protein kinase [Acidobacteriota bacterium]
MTEGCVEPHRWQRLQQLFERARELPLGKRNQWLAEVCPDDPDLCRRAESLLWHDEDPTNIFDIFRAANNEGTLLWEPLPGDRIGPYSVIRQLGRGGMGAVYLAERDDEQFRKQVAIKLVSSGLLLMPEVMARFRSERQILASLDHPNIARLLDGGAAPNGTPYVVMEYIDGTPIDQYCRARALSLDDRLRLFRKICSAVHYAHQNLIVHRDIKPDNVMVTAEGEPKLLDFGIAKLLDPAAAKQTRTRARVMTPDYASPEQVRGEAVTTATDVYGLGVLLFELLTDKLPYRLASDDAYELEQAICNAEPMRPSTLRLDLRGDLENILLKALRKDPARRYASAEQFSDDIRRYLEGYPVIAQADSWSYRAGKFLRRNAAASAAALMATMLLAAFAISMTVQAQRIARERDVAAQERRKSQQVAGFLTDLFRLADPARTKGGTVTARELLDNGAKRLETELAGQPELQATMLNEIGIVHRSLGLYTEARAHIEKALQLRRRALGPRHAEVAASLQSLSQVLRDLNEYDAALAAARESLAIRRERLGNQHPDLAPSLNALAVLLEDKAEYAQSEKLHREAIAILRGQPDLDERMLAVSLNNLAGVLGRMGNSRQVVPLFEEALALRRKVLGRDHLETSQTLNNLSNLYRDRGDTAAAEAGFNEVLSVRRGLFGPDHPEVAKALTNLAATYTQAKRYDEAIQLLNEAETIFRQRLGPDHLNVAFVLDNIASVHHAKGDYAAAQPYYDRTKEMFRARFGDDHPETATSDYNTSGNYLAWGKLDLAEQHARLAERVYRIKTGPGSPARLRAQLRLAEILTKKREWSAAAAAYRAALGDETKNWSATGQIRIAALSGLGEALAASGALAEAEPVLLECHALLSKEGKDQDAIRQLRDQIAALYQKQRQPDKARAFLREQTAATARADGPPTEPLTAPAR